MTLQIDRLLDPVEPVEAVPEWVYEDVELGGESWNYRIRWNDRAERWVIDVYNSAGTKAVYGTRMVPNFFLNAGHTGRIPTGGGLMLLDQGDPEGRAACTYEGLGHRWQLVWVVDDGLTPDAVRPWTITVP